MLPGCSCSYLVVVVAVVVRGLGLHKTMQDSRYHGPPRIHRDVVLFMHESLHRSVRSSLSVFVEGLLWSFSSAADILRLLQGDEYHGVLQ